MSTILQALEKQKADQIGKMTYFSEKEPANRQDRDGCLNEGA